jgi:hypothetical protein
MSLLKIRPLRSKIANVLPRNLRSLRWAHRTGWAVIAVADLAEAAHLAPGLPIRIHGLALAGCLALTIVLTWARSQAPVRAAFLDGMLYERSTADTQLLPTVPTAVGQNVIPMTPSSGRHRPSPRRMPTR